jgi:hypothetical protein
MQAQYRKSTDRFEFEQRWLVFWVIPAVMIWAVVAFLI